MTTSGRTVLVIMGAAVHPDGTPGPAVLRRTRGALDAGAALDQPLYLATGGSRRGGPAEAHVVARLLRESGVAAERILVDDRARDTLQSVINCAALLRAIGASRVIVCTDRYHMARCRMLFRLAGVPTRAARLARGHSRARPLRTAFAWVREAIALPFDAALLLVRRRRPVARTPS